MEAPAIHLTADTAMPMLKEALTGASAAGVAAAEGFSVTALACGGKIFELHKADFPPDKWHEVMSYIWGDEVPKAGCRIQKIMGGLLAAGIPHGNWIFDTALAAYLLDPARGERSAAEIAECFLQESIAPGAAAEAAANLTLYEKLQEELSSAGMTRLFRTIELPLCEVLADMEFNGITVNRAGLAEFGEKLSADIEKLQNRIFEETGEEFNLNSPKQLGTVLFEHLNLPAGKKNKNGYSTDIAVLEKLKDKHPAVSGIIGYRQLSKLKSTYVDGILPEIAEDGRVHGSFHLMTTATGRLSSSNPNLQNIPARTALGSEIRRLFVPGAADALLMDADYSQIELRVLAEISGDENMRQAFRNGTDIHTLTASQVFGVPAEEVTGEMRHRAKAVNFGIVYGISAFALAADIEVSREEASEYMRCYLERFPGVRDYMKNVVAQARKDGYVTSISGRRRYLPELSSKVFAVRSFGERVALNAPIQGSAADIIFIAMNGVYRRLKRENMRSKLLLQVHDELLLEVPDAEASAVRRILQEEMENAVSLSVPLTVEINTGRNWAEAKN